MEINSNEMLRLRSGWVLACEGVREEKVGGHVGKWKGCSSGA